MTIVIAHMVQPSYVKTRYDLSTERIREQLADDLVDRIMGRPESEAVIVRPSMVGPMHSPRLGRWGKDEPFPTFAVE